MKLRGRLFGLALSAATLLALIPMGSANAAESDVDLTQNETITINAHSDSSLSEHKFAPVLVGAYTAAVSDGTNLTGVSVETESNVLGSATRAYTKVNGTPASGAYANNPIGAAASQWLGFSSADNPDNADTTSSDGATDAPYSGKLRDFVTELTARSDTDYNHAEGTFQDVLDGTAEQTAPKGATSLTLTGLKPGLYVIIDTTFAHDVANRHQDSGSIPMFVGTKAGGMSFANQSLGVVNMKSDFTEKPVLSVDGDASTTYRYGEDINYTMTSKVPLTTGYHSYMYKLISEPSAGLVLVDGSVKVTVNGHAIPAWTTEGADPGYVMTTDLDENTAHGHNINFDLTHCILNQPYQSEIKISYKMQIVKGAGSQLSNTPAVDHTNTTYNQPNSPDNGIGGGTMGPLEGDTNMVNVYNFDLVNESKADHKQMLTGAHFEVTDPKGNKVDFYNTAKGKYSAAVPGFEGHTTTDLVVPKDGDGDAREAGDSTQANALGHLDVDRLSPGTYTVEQTQSATGFSGQFLPKFKVVVTANTYVDPQSKAKFELKPDQWGLVTTQSYANPNTAPNPLTGNGGVIVVYAVNGVSQLPLTGSAGMILAVAIAVVLLALGGALIVMRLRGSARARR